MRRAAVTAVVAAAFAFFAAAQTHADPPLPPGGGALVSRLQVSVCLGEQATWCSPSRSADKTDAGPAAGAGSVVAKSVGIECPRDECEAVVSPGTTIKLTARANEAGYSPHKFVRWDGCSSAKKTVCTVTVRRKAAVRAVFVSTT